MTSVSDYERAAHQANPDMIRVGPYQAPQPIRRGPWIGHWDPAKKEVVWSVFNGAYTYRSVTENGFGHPATRASARARRRAGALTLSFVTWEKLLRATVLTVLAVVAIAGLVTLARVAHWHF